MDSLPDRVSPVRCQWNSHNVTVELFAAQVGRIAEQRRLGTGLSLWQVPSHDDISPLNLPSCSPALFVLCTASHMLVSDHRPLAATTDEQMRVFGCSKPLLSETRTAIYAR
jgi:hypothetical protein